MSTDKCDAPHKPTERQSPDGHLIRSRKAFDKIQHAFLRKVLESLGIQADILQIKMCNL